VGGSRLYRPRQGRLPQIITDHTFLRELVEHGDMTAVEATPHPLRNMLDQCVDAKAACRSTASPAWSPTIGCCSARMDCTVNLSVQQITTLLSQGEHPEVLAKDSGRRYRAVDETT
jgi:protein phosphatase